MTDTTTELQASVVTKELHGPVPTMASIPPPHHRPPRRYIYNDTDLHHFLSSPSKTALFNFTRAMGHACSNTIGISSTVSSSNRADTSLLPPFLTGISPGMACCHGALTVLLEWVTTDFPPTHNNNNNNQGRRFGDPMFRSWHARLQERSHHIIDTILRISHDDSKTKACHDENDHNDELRTEQDEFDPQVLLQAYEAGQNAARCDTTTSKNEENVTFLSDHHPSIVTELSCYLQDAFGHAIRLDYGTGHETSFQIFLFLLCQLRVFHNIGYHNHVHDTTASNTTPGDDGDDDEDAKLPPPQQQQQQQQQEILPSPQRCKAIIISIYQQYLTVTRALQIEYMLEPAGSHGVWGLDDYHCLPFYYGACQLIPEQKQHQSDDTFHPSSIHSDQILQEYGDTYLYYGCIRFIKAIKKNVPFFESSPMLNDISHIATWYKISLGLLKLYEGEVLSKRPVVQHLIFGALFPANWTPSQTEESMIPPTETFRTIATSTTSRPASSSTAAIPPNETRAPWAK